MDKYISKLLSFHDSSSQKKELLLGEFFLLDLEIFNSGNIFLFMYMDSGHIYYSKHLPVQAEVVGGGRNRG